MCGIVGVLDRGRSGRALGQLAGSMADALVHRGPDDAGTFVDAEAGLALGHRRLSIIDLSALGHQPMVSQSGRFVVTFNGEIYNFRELRAQLRAAGASFRSESDTEVLTAGAEHWRPEDLLGRLNGIFAFGLWDREERALYLARDRLGVKPLYYAEQSGKLVFASELKAILRGLGRTPSIDREALTGYFRFGYVPGERTIYEGVRKLPPGSVACLRGQNPLSVERYWSLAGVAQAGLHDPDAGSDVELVDKLDTLLHEVVKSQVVSDVPIGAFLSGGIDSSAVAAIMQAESNRPVQTFTIGVRNPGYDESRDARAVAAHLGTQHHELVVTPREACQVIPRLADLYDEPFADSSQIPTFLVSQLARKHVTVSLSGDGGDELFAGYNRYMWLPRVSSASRLLPPAARRAVSRALQLGSLWPGEAGIDFGRLLPASMGARLPAQKLRKIAWLFSEPSPMAMYRRVVSQWPTPERVVIGGTEAQPSDAPLDEFTDLTSWMMIQDQLSYLPDDILQKVDRASMGVSLEVRVPLLDNRIVDFAWRLPRRMKVRDSTSKHILREVLYRYVPRELVDRPKTGFGVPIGEWLAGDLREWAGDLLSPDRIRRRGFLNPAPIAALLNANRGGAPHAAAQLWTVLMFEAWLDRWM